MEVDVRRSNITHANGYSFLAVLVPFLGILVSIWYFSDRDEFRRREREV